jgi:iron complex transport system substrate-binding protein
MTRPPERIVSLLSSATEMIYAVGAGDRLVGVSHECDFPPEASGKPRVSFTNITVEAASAAIDVEVRRLLEAGRPLYEIDVDLLTRLRPDLIVTQAQCDVCAIRYQDVVDAVARTPGLTGTPIVSLNPQRLRDILDDIRRVGEACGRADQSEQCVAGLEARLDRLRRTSGSLAPDRRRRTACIEWIEPLMIAGNWTPELVDLAGGVQTFAEAGRHSTYTPWRDIAAYDPEVIVVMPCGFDLQRTVREAERLKDLPGWNDLAAVKNGRVYAVDGNALFNRAGPRIVDSAELLALLIHAELFSAGHQSFDRYWSHLR